MKRPALACTPMALALILAATAAPAQEPRTLDEINAEFDKAYRQIETARIQRMARLAASQPAAQANTTRELMLRQAIGAGLYTEAEPIAEGLLKEKGLSPQVGWLAFFVNLLAEAKRGAYDESLKNLEHALDFNDRLRAENPDARVGIALPESLRASLVDAYYQAVVQNDQFEVARKALTMVAERSESPLIRKMAASRVKELGLVGKPAPAIAGTDLDGKPLDLASLKGNVVLLGFWATWSGLTRDELEWLETFYDRYKDKGFRVVGINVDAMADGGRDADSVLPAVKHFAVEHNVRWPVLLNTPKANFADAYGISEVPANVMIGRDGTVIHLDLRKTNIEKVVTQALGVAR